MTENHDAYISILKEELIPAMGCTEPIAIAYCAALAKRLLGDMPDRAVIEASGSIIKNTKSVVVPNTDGMRGIPVAAAAGIIAGNPDKVLEVISEVSDEERGLIAEFTEKVPMEVSLSDSPDVFDIIVTLKKGESTARARITGNHTNVVLLEKDGTALLEKKPETDGRAGTSTDRSCLSMKGIYDFAETVDISEVRELLDCQISYNMAIASEGLRNEYGASIGRTIRGHNEGSLKYYCISMAAAGSDARMNGCELPVIINSGSGNQGITCSVPVIVYARERRFSEERLYRALVLSNLTAIYQKSLIGCLSAYCGAVNAGAAAGCGIAYLKHHTLEMVEHTLSNALAISSGIVCDGAKASCAGKIAIAVETGILGMEMYEYGQQFFGGEGIVKNSADNTVLSVGMLGRDGMKETDREILNIMMKD